MIKNHSPFKNIIILLLIFLSFLSIFEVSLILKINKQNKEVITIKQASSLPAPTINIKKVFITTKRRTLWNNKQDSTIGSFYEITLFNTTNSAFTDWSVKFPIPQNAYVENQWNCNVLYYDGFATIKPHYSHSSSVKSNNNISFGFTLSYKNTFIPEEYEISGRFVQNILSNITIRILFIIILIIITGIIFSLVAFFIFKRQVAFSQEQQKRDNEFIEQTMKSFTNFIDNKDPYTSGHSIRVANFTKEIARRMGFDEQNQLNMYYAALMHDIGKITVPDEILMKQTTLSTDEWERIQKHTENGVRLLKDFTVLPIIKDAVLYHHERYDGNGYVSKLKGEQIPLVARIVCIADSFDAMTSNRYYRLKFSDDRTIKELERCAGKQFDPNIVVHMIEMIKDGTVHSLQD